MVPPETSFLAVQVANQARSARAAPQPRRVLSRRPLVPMASGDGAGGAPAREPPGSLGLPVVGEVPAAFSTGVAEFFRAKVTALGPVFRTHFLFEPAVLAGSADTIREVLAAENKGAVKPALPESFTSLVGPEMILGLSGAKHATLRRAVAPAFSRAAVEGYMPAITALLLQYAATWRSRPPSASFPLRSDLRSLAFAFIASVMLGPEDASPQALAEMEEHFEDVAKGLIAVAPAWVPLTAAWRARRARDKLAAVIRRAIAARRQSAAAAARGRSSSRRRPQTRRTCYPGSCGPPPRTPAARPSRTTSWCRT